MSSPGLPYRLFPLGDSAISIEFGNSIDENINKEVVARFQEWRSDPPAGMIELIPAYSTLTIHYDIALLRKNASDLSAFERMKQELEIRLTRPAANTLLEERLVRIPVCYEKEFATDIQRVASAKNITVEELVAIHCSCTYKVYMLGFLPGFAYMGGLDERIAMPRKPQPMPIAAGSVGIAGKQTGIYPLDSPGGWQIIGRTALKLFDAEKPEPILLRAGDRVQFYPVSRDEFDNMRITENKS